MKNAYIDPEENFEKSVLGNHMSRDWNVFIETNRNYESDLNSLFGNHIWGLIHTTKRTK